MLWPLVAEGGEVGHPCFTKSAEEPGGHGGVCTDDGLRAVTEALVAMDKNAECHYAADIYRLQGELLLQQAQEQQGLSTAPLATQRAAEVYIQRAREMAQHQHAKFQELRAAMTLSRLWQMQGKQTKAWSMLGST
jgi:hypothetical protein